VCHLKPATNNILNQGSILGGVHFSTAEDASPTGSAPQTAGAPRATWQESAKAVFEGTYDLPATSDYYYHGMSLATAAMASSAFGFNHRNKNGDRRSGAHRHGHTRDINDDDTRVDVWVTLAARVSLNRSCAALPRWYTIAFALSAASTERRQTALALEIQHQAESRARADVLQGSRSTRAASLTKANSAEAPAGSAPLASTVVATTAAATGAKKDKVPSSSQQKRALVELQTLLDRFLQRDQLTSVAEAHSVVSAATWMISVPSEREAVASMLLSFLPQLVVLFQGFAKSKDTKKSEQASQMEGAEETETAADSGHVVSTGKPDIVTTNLPESWLALPPLAMDFSAFQHFTSRCRLSAENKHLSASQLQQQQQQVMACFQRSNVLDERWSPCAAFQQKAAARDAKLKAAARLDDFLKPRAARHVSVVQPVPSSGAGAEATTAPCGSGGGDAKAERGDKPTELENEKIEQGVGTGDKFGVNRRDDADYAGMGARANAE